jgi:adenylate cyclase
MLNGHSNLLEFGKCRLDVDKKLLWARGEPVQVPLKVVELLCVLVERRGEVVTKDEIWQGVWQDAFVEETNLTHTIYLLRKTLRDLGEGEIIKTIPRRGYRFAASVVEIPNVDVVVERYALTRTLIEIENKPDEAAILESRPAFRLQTRLAVVLIAVVAITAAGLVANGYLNGNSVSPPIRSLAVLPFRNIGSRTGVEHQGIGIADVLITRLGRIKGVDIRPTSAVAKFEDTPAASIDVGKELQADAVLDGTVYATEKKVRVTARLLRVADGAVIWSGEFEKLPGEILKLQNELALQITNSLSRKSSEDGQRPFTENAEAFELYAKGRYEWDKRNSAGMIEAEKMFRSAIEKDPEFTLAYVGLADKLAITSGFVEAEEIVNKALSLDPNSAEAYATRGFINIFYRWNWKDAENDLNRSIALKPGYGSAHQWLGILFEIEGKNADSIRELQRAVEIDPSSPNFEADLGQAYYFDHQYDLARSHCRMALELAPDFTFAHGYLEFIGLVTGDRAAAIDEWETNARLANDYPTQTEVEKQHIAEKYEARAVHFRAAPAAEFLNELIEEKPLTPEACYGNARIYALRGDKENALTNLACTAGSKNFGIVFVKADPIFDGLRYDPRFQAILDKMKLPDV